MKGNFLLDTRRLIATHGQSVIGVFGHGKPPFTYTIGLHGSDLPELLVFGLKPEVAADLLNNAADMAREGKLVANVKINELANFPVVFVPLDSEVTCDKYTLLAASYYDHPVDVWQMVLTDRDGLFPWDPHCAKNHIPTQGDLIDWTAQHVRG